MKNLSYVIGLVAIFGLMLVGCENAITNVDSEVPTSKLEDATPRSHLPEYIAVTEDDEELWFTPFDKNLGESEAEFTDEQPQLGTGSIKLSTADGSDKASIATARYGQKDGYKEVDNDWPGAGDYPGEAAGTPLDEITHLSYATYVEQRPEGSSIAPYLQIEINPDASTGEGYAALVFDPSAADQDVNEEEWQTWNTLNEPAWRIHPSFDYMTWDEVVAEFNNPTVKYTINVSAGRGWDGDFTGYTDEVKIGVDGGVLTYSFEAYPHVSNRDDCKDGAWEDLGFRNQGECIQFVNTGHDSR